VFLKKDLTDQLATLRKQNLKYVDFANKSIDELFSEQDIRGSVVKQFTFGASVIALNDGKGDFKIKKLPLNVQLSSVNAIETTDVNDDGLPDLVMGGNEFNLLPQFCRLDASMGHLLVNKGNGEFEWIYPDRSGLEVRGQVRDIQEVRSKNGRYLIFLQNGERPVVYKVGGE
jgi:enediyne biosynthesis protein E4